jgi:DNA-binding MarR family transcriptional regulator
MVAPSTRLIEQSGDALRRLVDLVSHRTGRALTVMNEASVSLPQVLLLSHVDRGARSPSDLAGATHVSLPAVSQMIERLVQQGLLVRTEDEGDRRRKSIAITRPARVLLRKLGAARSAEYALGLASLSPALLREMRDVATRAVDELQRAQARRMSA